ncbi:MAG: hypothetical protein ACFCU8_17105 [Thermosynechococcaceae cyanobacterium]
MKKLILVALATLPFLGTPLFAKPAAADVIIKLPSPNSTHRSIFQTPSNHRPVKTWRKRTPAPVQVNRLNNVAVSGSQDNGETNETIINLSSEFGSLDTTKLARYLLPRQGHLSGSTLDAPAILIIDAE